MKLEFLILFLGLALLSLVNSFTLEERDGGVPEILKPQRRPFLNKDSPNFRKPPVQIPHMEKDGGNPIPKQICSCGVLNPNGATRVIGGNETIPGEIPWRVTVQVFNTSFEDSVFCGGTIISPNWVMTAAHCTDGARYNGFDIFVYTEAQANPVTVGGGVKNYVDLYVQHHAFDIDTFANDISLLHLSTPLTYKPNVSPACLPIRMIGESFSGTSVLASGWGTTKPVPVDTENNDPVSDTLLQVTLPVLSSTECQQYYGNLVTQNNICTYNPDPPKDTCQGDSGGSIDLLSNSRYFSIGIVSWGRGCAQVDNPGVYTKLTNYVLWIQVSTGEQFCIA